MRQVRRWITIATLVIVGLLGLGVAAIAIRDVELWGDPILSFE